MARLTGKDPSLLRRINSAVVLGELRSRVDGPAVTFTELAAATGLSRPTLEGVMDGLLAAGLAADAGAVAGGAESGDGTRRGRPARRFRFCAEAGHLLGVELGCRRITAVLSDLTGRVLGTLAHRVDEQADAQGRLARARGTVAELLHATGVRRETLRAVGAGTPGIVQRDGRVQLSTALPGWSGLPLGDRLSRSFRCPVLVENDANAAVLAERWRGAAAGADDVVMVLAGLSPGAGSLIGGRLHRGSGGAAGEIGALHLLGRESTPEHLLSVTGRPLPPLDEPAAARVFALADEGDGQARRAVDRFVQRLVHDVAALVLALDPELVVIGGWADGLEGVLEPLRRDLARYCLRPPPVALSGLGEAAVATGALRLALDHLESELFTVEEVPAP